VRIMPVASSAFTDGRGSRAKANQHRDVDVRFRKGEGITVTLTGLSAGKRSGVRQYRLGRRIAASVGKQFYCVAEAWCGRCWPRLVSCAAARCRVTATHPHLPAAGRQVTKRHAAAQNKKPRGEPVAIHQRRNQARQDDLPAIRRSSRMPPACCLCWQCGRSSSDRGPCRSRAPYSGRDAA
jgi:hypothetical protein